MVAAVESHEDALAVHAGDDGHRPAPYRLQVDERVLGVVDAQVDAVVTVGEEQLAAVLEVAVHHLDDGLPEVGELLEELALHLLELAVEDLPAVALLVEPVDEELLLGGEVGGEELVDEGDVVVVLAHLEDLLPAEPQLLVPGAPGAEVVALVILFTESPFVPAVLDVAPQFDAELVGIDGAGARSHRAAVMVGVVDDLMILERLLGHDRRVPEGVVVDEPSRGVPVGSFHGDVVDVGTSVLDGDDLVLPLLCLEPAPRRHVLIERGLLAVEAEADFVQEDLGGLPEDLDVPAFVFLQPTATQDPKVEQEQLHLLAHHFTGSAEDDACLAGISVAVEVGAQEGGDDMLGRTQDRLRHLPLPGARSRRESEFLDEKVRERFRMDDYAPTILDQGCARQQAEQLVSEL